MIRYRLTNVLYAPSMTATLVSMSKMDDAGIRFYIAEGKMHVIRPEGLLLGIISKIRGLWRVYHDDSPNHATRPHSYFER